MDVMHDIISLMPLEQVANLGRLAWELLQTFAYLCTLSRVRARAEERAKRLLMLRLSLASPTLPLQ